MADTGDCALPAFARFVAPPAWTAIDFVSDLHLSESTPRTFGALAEHLRCTEADAVFILGDLFEVWVGDDSRHHGFEAECAAMLAEASAHRFVAFMAGNRDFLVGADMLAHCGVYALADPTVVTAFGRRALLSHGDALCLSDTDYQRFRAEVRGAAWQERFLAQPLDDRRRLARAMRAESEQRKRRQEPASWYDLDAACVQSWMDAADASDFVHGHTHQPATHALPAGRTRHVLSDWDLDMSSAPRAEVLRWRSDGFARMAPAAAR